MGMAILQRRSYCIYPVRECSLDRLASTIYSTYIRQHGIFDELNISKVRVIQNQIRNGTYTLSHLSFVSKNTISNNLGNQYFLNYTCGDQSFCGGLTVNQEDRLVLYSLSQLLNDRLIELDLVNSVSFGSWMKQSCYYKHIVSSKEKPIIRLYQYNMIKSIMKFSKEYLLNQLEEIVDNDEIMRLCKAYLSMPVCVDGMIVDDLNQKIPTIENITDTFIDYTLLDLDMNFHDIFPSFTYSRYAHEIIVTTSDEDEGEDPYFSAFADFLDRRLKLPYEIRSIGPGDRPIKSVLNDRTLMRISSSGKLLLSNVV